MFETPCHRWHRQHDGRMVDFAGWEMPIQYSTIVAEHQAVRTAAGLFDISHMGRLRFRGPGAGDLLQHLLTADVAGLQIGQVRYALVTNEQGGILDDVLLTRCAESYLLVVNAANRLKILDWINLQGGGFDFQLQDETFSHGMVAVQGPRAVEIVNPLVKNDVAQLPYYWSLEDEVLGTPGLVSRTGYTGEDGFELIVPAENTARLWETLLLEGRTAGVVAAGLGCRDTLRLEAGMPLYGQELSEQIDPLTAGLKFAVKLDGEEFIGRDALRSIAKKGPDRRRIGLELEGKRIAREGSELFDGERPLGAVTSGTFSPTLERSIAMAYVANDRAEAGKEVEVDIRGRPAAATIVKLPFYRRPKG